MGGFVVFVEWGFCVFVCFLLFVCLFFWCFLLFYSVATFDRQERTAILFFLVVGFLLSGPPYYTKIVSRGCAVSAPTSAVPCTWVNSWWC